MGFNSIFVIFFHRGYFFVHKINKVPILNLLSIELYPKTAVVTVLIVNLIMSINIFFAFQIGTGNFLGGFHGYPYKVLGEN